MLAALCLAMLLPNLLMFMWRRELVLRQIATNFQRLQLVLIIVAGTTVGFSLELIEVAGK